MGAKKREKTEEQVSKQGSTHANMQFIQAIKQSLKNSSISGCEWDMNEGTSEWMSERVND